MSEIQVAHVLQMPVEMWRLFADHEAVCRHYYIPLGAEIAFAGGIHPMFMTGGVCFVNNALNMTRVARQSDMGQQEFQRKSLEEENALRRAVNEVFLSCESIHDWMRIFDPEHRNRMTNKYVTMWGAVMHFEAVLGNFT